MHKIPEENKKRSVRLRFLSAIPNGISVVGYFFLELKNINADAMSMASETVVKQE